jgi:mannosyl-oligosaccharide alpha-1,2-mannosidase
MDSQKRIRHVGSHLACFYGGNFIMGGKMLNNKTIVDIGLDLNEACWNTYAGSTSGIGPEGFAYISTDGNFTGSDISPEQIEFYGQHGFYSTSCKLFLWSHGMVFISFQHIIFFDPKFWNPTFMLGLSYCLQLFPNFLFSNFKENNRQSQIFGSGCSSYPELQQVASCFQLCCQCDWLWWVE